MPSLNQAIQLMRMADCHLSNTYRWLHDSAELRSQVDSLEAPTQEANQAYGHANWKDSRREDYAIVRTADNSHIGNCGLCDIDLRRRKAQLWIYLGDSYGKGTGTSAVGQLLFRAFDELNLDRVYLRVIASNPRALHFYQKLGFVEEGRFRQDTHFNGQSIDSVCMSMLKQEYRKKPEGGIL